MAEVHGKHPLTLLLIVKLAISLSVSSGCVDAAEHRDRVWAAEKKTSHEECERKPDRCFWTDGWDFYHQNRMLPGTCYYSKGKLPKNVLL